DIANDCGDRPTSLNCDSRFVESWLFQCVELAVEQRWIDQLVLAVLEAFSHQSARALEIHNTDVVTSVYQDFTIAPLQCRACDNNLPSTLDLCFDCVGQGLQPWPTIFIRERRSSTQLFNIGVRMIVVAVDMVETKPRRERRRDRALSGARHPHDD